MYTELQQLLSKTRLNLYLRKIFETLFAQDLPIVRLDLRTVRILPEDVLGFLKILSEITKLRTLRHIALQIDDLKDEQVLPIIEGLKGITLLETCWLTGSGGCGTKVISAIGEVVETQEGLKQFYLHSPSLSDEDSIILVAALKRNRSISQISIHGSQLERRGVEVVLSLLDEPIEALDVQCKALDLDSCRLLQQKLLIQTTLVTISLDADTITDLQVIMDGVRLNTSLTAAFIRTNVPPSKQKELNGELQMICERNLTRKTEISGKIASMEQQLKAVQKELGVHSLGALLAKIGSLEMQRMSLEQLLHIEEADSLTHKT